MKNGMSVQKYYGPGNWDSLHLMAANAKTSDERNAVRYLIDLFSTKFCCKKCQKHFNNFLKKHPVSKYEDKKNGLFYWTWKSHNNASLLAGKKPLSYEKAKKIYKV